MQIRVLPYERQVLEELEAKFRLDRSLVAGLASSLSRFYGLFARITFEGDEVFRQGRVVLAGLANHTHHLVVGGLSALEQGNGHVWSACARGLIETLGGCVIAGEQPAAVPNFLSDRITAGRLRAAAERGRPGLKNDVDRLNNIVHPASRAILAGFQAVDPGGQKAVLRYGLRQPDPQAAREGVVVLGNLVEEILARLEDLSSRPEVVNAGTLVMKRADVSDDTEP